MDARDRGQLTGKRRVGFVDLPDASAATFLRYAEDPAWEVSIVIARDVFSEVGRRAASLGVPLRDTPVRALLADCDRLIVGDDPPSLLPSIREMLRSTKVDVLGLGDVGSAVPAPARAREDETEAPAAPDVPPGPAESPDAPAAPPPEPPISPFAEEGSCFHAATLLGAEVPLRAGVRLEVGDGRLQRSLAKAREVTGALTASVMLLDSDGRHLRIAVAEGLDAATIAKTRRAVGAGLAGRVFTSGKPEALRAGIPPRAEDESSVLFRFAASVPLQSGGQTIGVLSVNIETGEEVGDRVLIDRLAVIAKEVGGAVLGAVDVGPLRTPGHRAALLRQVDRIMSLEETLPTRMGVVAEVLRRCLQADSAKVFLVDPLHRQLLPMGAGAIPSSKGLGAAAELGSGFLGWVMSKGKPRLLEAHDEASGERRALVIFPVHAPQPHSLFVFENVPVGERSGKEILEILEEAIVQVEDMIGVEEGVAAQELVSELEMRIADQSSQLANLPPELAIRSVLEFTLDLLAAEAAAWLPGDGGAPVSSHSASLTAARILAGAWAKLETLREWVRERGIVAGGSRAWGWDTEGPEAPSPYVGVCARDERSVLLLFFSDDLGSVAQVPAYVLRRALMRITERIAECLEKPAPTAAPPPAAGFRSQTAAPGWSSPPAEDEAA